MPSRSLTLPLFPLHAVVFPGGLLSLKVFEPRYVDLVTRCLRERQAFGVVTLPPGEKALRGAALPVHEPVGVSAEVIDLDATVPGILQARCRGVQRFDVLHAEPQPDGLLLATVALRADDAPAVPPVALVPTVRSLATAIGTLKNQGSEPFLKPYAFDDAGWVANRWCEILPISVAAKYKLMELPDALVRLRLVDDFLRSKGVIEGR